MLERATSCRAESPSALRELQLEHEWCGQNLRHHDQLSFGFLEALELPRREVCRYDGRIRSS